MKADKQQYPDDFLPFVVEKQGGVLVDCLNKDMMPYASLICLHPKLFLRKVTGSSLCDALSKITSLDAYLDFVASLTECQKVGVRVVNFQDLPERWKIKFLNKTHAEANEIKEAEQALNHLTLIPGGVNNARNSRSKW